MADRSSGEGSSQSGDKARAPLSDPHATASVSNVTTQQPNIESRSPLQQHLTSTWDTSSLANSLPRTTAHRSSQRERGGRGGQGRGHHRRPTLSDLVAAPQPEPDMPANYTPPTFKVSNPGDRGGARVIGDTASEASVFDSQSRVERRPIGRTPSAFDGLQNFNPDREAGSSIRGSSGRGVLMPLRRPLPPPPMARFHEGLGNELNPFEQSNPTNPGGFHIGPLPPPAREPRQMHTRQPTSTQSPRPVVNANANPFQNFSTFGAQQPPNALDQHTLESTFRAAPGPGGRRFRMRDSRNSYRAGGPARNRFWSRATYGRRSQARLSENGEEYDEDDDPVTAYRPDWSGGFGWVEDAPGQPPPARMGYPRENPGDPLGGYGVGLFGQPRPSPGYPRGDVGGPYCRHPRIPGYPRGRFGKVGASPSRGHPPAGLEFGAPRHPIPGHAPAAFGDSYYPIRRGRSRGSYSDPHRSVGRYEAPQGSPSVFNPRAPSFQPGAASSAQANRDEMGGNSSR